MKIGMVTGCGDGYPLAHRDSPSGAVVVIGIVETDPGIASATIIPDSLVRTSGCPENPTAAPQPSSSAPWSALLARLVSPAAALTLLDLGRLARWIAPKGNGPAPEDLLSPAERDQFRRYRHPKRRLEWLGGRLAAKHCLHQLAALGLINAVPWHEHTIHNDTHGRPYVSWTSLAGSPPALSISHCRGYAAALVRAGGACGLDIEHISPRLAAVQARFSTPREITLLHAVHAPLTRLAVIWTVKEAVKKCFLHDQPTFVSRISLTDVTIDPTAQMYTVRCQVDSQEKRTAVVRVAALGDFMLACTEMEIHA